MDIQQPGCEILLAQADPAEIALVREALQSHGVACSLHILESGAQTLSFIEDLGRLDLLLLDTRLPREDSEDILKKLRATERFARTPVIVMTAGAASAEEAASSEPLLRYFRKPSTPAQFMELGGIVKDLLAGSKPARAVKADFLAGAGEMGGRIRAFEWAGTPLGAIEQWPHSLKNSISLILNSRHPMWIGWGPHMTFLYNDAYVHVLGPAKHPSALGLPASEVWREIWNVCGPLADKVFENGEATFVDDVRLFMSRGHFLEETFYSFSYSPIRDDSGQVCGLFCPSTDVTAKVLNARRLATLSQLSAQTLAERTASAACATVARTLGQNSDDIPFALLYLADAEGGEARLEQAVGGFAQESLPALTRTVDLGLASEKNPWPIAAVYASSHRQIVATAGIEGLPHGVADQPVVKAVVLPVASRGEHNPHGVLVAGVNPCRPLDADYLTFFELIASQMAIAIQNAKAIEEEKKRADLLVEIDRAKTVFFSNVSHEFRTPLTLMLGPLENLLSKPDGLGAEQREELTVAHRNSLRLLKLVNSLLDFSRLEAGRLKPSFTPTDLPALTADLASNFSSAMQAAGLELAVDCEQPFPEPVYVDREMWEKIVLNLLSNAFKFTFEGSVSVLVRASDGNAVLTVSDTGIGIAEAELPRIFERFHRVDGARSRTYEGTGIGLALIQEYVKLHGGEISAESETGKGSTFTVTLPFGMRHLPPEHIGKARDARSSTAIRAEAFTDEAESWLRDKEHHSEKIASPQEAGTKARILLADDNADMREHVARILAADYELETARDGEEALALIRRNPPDLLLSDVMMPRLDGFGLLRALRADVRTQMLPVIFLSARASEEMRVEGLLAGADDFIVKPFTASELRARVGTHVQMAMARRRATEREAALRTEAESARDRVIAVLEGMTDGYLALDRDWRLIYVNGEAERLDGARREEMLGKNYWDLFPSAAGTTLHRELLRAAKDRVSVDFENYYEPWKRWFHVKAHPAADGGLSVFYEDVSGRKRAEEERAALFAQAELEIEQRKFTQDLLRDSEQRFREMVDALPAAIYTTDAEGRLMHFNPAAVRLSGRVPELGTDKWCITWKLLRPDGTVLPHDQCPMAIALREGRIVSGVECIAERPDGSRFWFTPFPTPLRDGTGRITGGINMLVDITERKAAEEALRRSEERFRGVFETSAVGVAIRNLEGRFLQANRAFCEITGYSEEELHSSEWQRLTHPDDHAAMQNRIGQLIAGKVRTFVLEKRYFTKDGRTIWVSNSVSATRDAEGKPEYLIALCEDITARKQAQADLQESEERFRAIVETNPECVKVVAADGALLHMNSAGLEMLGAASADQVLGRPVYDMIAPEYREAFRKFNERVCGGEKSSLEFDIVGLQGLRRHMESRAAPLRKPDGTMVQLAITRDITDRKRSEDAIRELNAQLTTELVAMKRMQRLSTKLVQADDFTQLLGEIIDAGIEITGAAIGNIQLLEDGSLNIVSQRGFDEPFLNFFKSVQGIETACGAALQQGQRVIVEDVADSPLFGDSAREVMLGSGARALQSTPLVSRSGQALGVFSTHYSEPRRPGDRELRLLDVLARQAADLIERKRAETELLASEGRFRQLANAMPQIVWTARPDGHADYYNERWYEFSGFDRDLFGDTSWRLILHPEDQQRWHDTWYASVERGEPYRIEYRFWDRAENRWRWFMGRALPVRGSDSAIVKWFGTCTDIDEQKRVEDELRRANQDLEQFAYSASHDLQEPLRSIKIYGELLSKRHGSKLDGEAAEFLDFLRTGATRMETLVRDLLQYTQVARLDPRAEGADARELTDANEALAATLVALAGAIAESGATVACDPLPNVPVHSTHLKQLFQNLAGNAIKYRHPQRKPEVRISARKQGSYWIFSVRDNGIGIQSEHKERIFGLFKRLHTSNEYSGTGIGLAICQRIVERYQGRIWVESEPENGSTFFFTIAV